MPFVTRVVEPKFLSRNSLLDEDGKPKVTEYELEAVTNNTLANALRQLASLVLVANDIFNELGIQLQGINRRSEGLKVKINLVEEKLAEYDPKKVTVPESDICSFSLLKKHYVAKCNIETNLFSAENRPEALRALYESASKTPVNAMRHLDRWRRDGHRSSRFFLCTPVLGAKRRKLKGQVDIDIETRVPAAVEDLRRWTSTEALGDITVTPDCPNRITGIVTDGDITDGTIGSDDEGIDHKLPSPEEQLHVVALKFPSEIVAVDVSGRSFDRLSFQRRSLLHGDIAGTDGDTVKRRTRSRRPRNKRRNTLAGTDQKEIQDALTAGVDPSASPKNEADDLGAVCRSRSSDLLRTPNKKESPEIKKSHFNTLKQWGKSRYDRFMNKSSESAKSDDIDDFNIYETVTMKRRRNIDKDKRTHQRSASVSSSEKSSINIPISTSRSGVMSLAVKLRDSSIKRRERRSGGNKDEPHSSSGNWSASSESGRNSVGSEITTTTQPKSTTSAATSSNSLNLPAPSSVNSRRRFNVNASTTSSVTSEGTLTPDIIHDLHEDGETSSIYSCDTEGYYTSFHMDSGLKTLKEEELPVTPIHCTSALTNSNSAENDYELFGKGSTSTTTSSQGTICTTLRASGSSKSLISGPTVPERKSSLHKENDKSPESSLERDFGSDKTGTVKRSPATIKANITAIVHKENGGDISPDSGHNTSSSPIESINSPNGVRSCSEFEFSESSDMEGPERIERIRVKTTINSSRIPSMCVITPSQSDDEGSQTSSNNSKNQHQMGSKNSERTKLDLPLKSNEENNKENCNMNKISKVVKAMNKMQLVNVDQRTGYATVESIENVDQTQEKVINRNFRSSSPSGGTVIIKEEVPITKLSQPIIKSTLLPLNNMFGKLRTNLANFAHRRDSKSPNRNNDTDTNTIIGDDMGEYVTIADVRNNNKTTLNRMDEITYANCNDINKNLKTVLSGKIRETEYVSLNELPCNESHTTTPTSCNNDSLERKTRREGARVTLNAEGKVIYSSDSLKRRKGAHTTFEPGPFVKPTNSPCASPLPAHRTPKAVRPVTTSESTLSPQLGKVVIRAASGLALPTSEVVRMPPAAIVTPNNRPLSPKLQGGRGAYVHVRDAPSTPTQDKDRVPNLPSPEKMYPQSTFRNHQPYQGHFREPLYGDPDTRQYLEHQYYLPRGPQMYQTLPSKKSQALLNDNHPERSVTPDITRGLERNPDFAQKQQFGDHYERIQHPQIQSDFRAKGLLNPKLGIPVSMPQLMPRYDMPDGRAYSSQFRPIDSTLEVEDSLKISPIDPRNSGAFQSSTPSAKPTFKAATNLEALLSPKKSTMSNEELYAVIHKSKKRMNIGDNEIKTPQTISTNTITPKQLEKVKSPETGYIGDKSRSRLSWSPSKGEYVDFSTGIDKNINESRTRQSWACNEKKNPQTSRLDFKKLLLQKSGNILSNNGKKLSAVEQLKLSKQQAPSKPKTQQQDMSILELSGSPRSLVNRRFIGNNPGSPKHIPDKAKQPKILSPRSQWRFANPRTDVLSSTILEDCREDESSPNNSIEKKFSPIKLEYPKPNVVEESPKRTVANLVERRHAQRAEFFQTHSGSKPTSNQGQFKPQTENIKDTTMPTLETSF